MTKQAYAGVARADAQGCPLPDSAAKVDLHLHSVYSDGVKTPEELCRMARKAGVGTVALTDHDTARGVQDMLQAAQRFGLQAVPGVEVSTGQGGRVHVLGYGPAVLGPELTAFFQSTGTDRIGRAEETFRRLDELGVHIPPEARAEVLSQPNAGRPHIARAMVAAGAVSTVKQAFDQYLADGGPAYVPRRKMATGDAIRMLRQHGAVPVLAHPTLMQQEWPALCALVEEWIGCGLMGIEAYHSSASGQEARQLEELARRHGLLVTGGSDYHGDPGATLHVGRMAPGWNSRGEDVLALMQATQR